MYNKASEPKTLCELREQAKDLLANPPLQDTIVSVVYRATQTAHMLGFGNQPTAGNGGSRPAVSGVVVVAGKNTRDLHPVTRLEPLHFVKVYHPGTKGEVAREWERTKVVAASMKPPFFPRPLGYETDVRAPFAPESMKMLDIGWADKLDIYRSKVVPGKTLAAVSPLGTGHYLGANTKLDVANKWSKSDLQRLWLTLEDTHKLLQKHHRSGVSHGDSHRHNLMLVETGTKWEPVFVDYEAAKFKTQMLPQAWKLRCEDDFDDLLREAMWLQKTKLGPQVGDLANHAKRRERDLCGVEI
jgi:hypothetical protein